MLWRILILLLFSGTLHAQTFNAAPFLAMGNTGLGQSSLYSITNNPAGIAALKQSQVGLAYQSHFLSSDIQSQAIYAVLPFASSHVVGFGANNYGLKDVSSLLTMRGVYAKRFGQTFATAIAANYHRFYVQNYQSDHTTSLDLGFQYYVGDRVTLGLLIRNATSSVFPDDTPQYIAQYFATGFAYSISEQIQVASDIYYDIHNLFNYRGGLAYRFDHRVVIRGGAASHPMQYFGGIGLSINKVQVDIASSFHPRLGTSPQLALAYGF
ncbi:MAG TPA: DNA-binding protein [Sphingobacterium sp.]|nr:DNA-binding protein [Sphingobacterium sp.]